MVKSSVTSIDGKYKGWKKDPKYVKFMKKFFKEHPALDLGCGDDKWGDVSVDGNPRFNPDYVWDLNKFPWPFESNSYPTINFHHVLEHLRYPEKALDEVKRILKPNGIMILTVPHPNHPTYRNPEHNQFFTEKSIVDLTRKFFKIEQIIKWKGTELMPFPVFIHKILGKVYPSEIIIIARKK